MVKVLLDNVTKVFGKGKKTVVALDHISLEIKSEEFFVILGPSGGGKTTTLRLIAGLEEPTDGEIWIGDKLVASASKKIFIPPNKRNVGMVFQNWALYPHMKAFDNIAFPLKIKRVPKDKINSKVMEVAKMLEIDKVLDRYPRQLSGGQQQRVALARALVKEPQVLLLDEPFSNLDARLRATARALVKDIHKKFGITSILVSHDPADMLSLADRAGVIFNGKMNQIGVPMDLYDKPANLAIANLVGEINIIEGTLKGGEFTANDLLIRLPVKSDLKAAVLGIRPEDMSVKKDEEVSPGESPLGWGVVRISEYAGGKFTVVVDIGGNTLRISASAPIPRDEKVFVVAVTNKIKIFDKETGINILNEEQRSQ
ncbi:glucose ABC transporter ATP-binding protein GlcV [Thermocladium modestius]|uniref:glucose ABC transporter ATP-binding protein GlcV n=1 Tax=Thermocladium modestius TaxID=62609 RepID=UPI0016665D31|nr:glucose ABC transporter ATP-binding protein GlcV [Thermocladium modestius]